jgi:hypothetical protein
VNQIVENVQMEKQISVQNEVIRDLKDKMDYAENQEKGDQAKEIYELILEINLLNKTNREKM